MTEISRNSTAAASRDEDQRSSSAETGHMVVWDIALQQPDIESFDLSVGSLDNLTSTVTVAEHNSVLERMLSNVTGAWDRHLTATARYTSAPYCRTVNFGSSHCLMVGDSHVPKWADSMLLLGRVPVFLMGTDSRLEGQHFPIPEGSTEGLEVQLFEHFGNLIDEASDEVFIDGVDSMFSHRMTLAIENYGNVAVGAIDRLIGLRHTNAEVLGEILRLLGSIVGQKTHHSRLTVLLQNLQSPDPRIRDAASLGLAALDDPAAIDAVERSVDREPSLQLQANLRLVMDQLRSTQ